MKAVKEKLSMDEYLDFVLSSKEVNLSVRHMNEIISMHGFKRIHKTRKSVLSDAINTLDLMDPWRSTLKEDISPFAAITYDDMMTDLNDLSWQECCVTSIKTLSSCSDIGDPSSLPRSNKVAPKACGRLRKEPAASTSSLPGPTKRKRTKKVRELALC